MTTVASGQSRQRAAFLVLVGATTAGIVGCALLAAPFLAPLVWATTLAILFAPLHARIAARLKYRNLAATVSVLIVAVFILLPTAFIVKRMVDQVASGATYIQQQVDSGTVQRFMDQNPQIAPIGNWVEQHVGLRSVTGAVASQLSRFAASFVRGSVAQVLSVLLTFYLLFFFLRDRHSVARLVRYISPLGTRATQGLIDRILDTVRATVWGTAAVSAVQGALGGLMFWILGLPAPVVWGFTMAILSLVPVLGAFLVWIPAALFLALEGSWTKAIVLTVWGVVIIGGIDNLLRPVWVGSRLKLHTVAAFISMLGGILLFGASGFVLGPVIMTVTMGVMEIWHGRRPGGQQP
jgi:predicted PurR-regulated permease PerM